MGLVRSVLLRITAVGRRRDRALVPVPVSFDDMVRARQQQQGSTADRTPCRCPQCRHQRSAAARRAA